jgi:hypothetical protein
MNRFAMKLILWKLCIYFTLLTLAVFSFSAAQARMDTRRERMQGDNEKPRTIVYPPPYDDFWKGHFDKHPGYYDNDPNAAKVYDGRFPYGYDYAPGDTDPNAHPGYPMETERVPHWLKKSEDKWVSVPMHISLLRDPDYPQDRVLLHVESNEMIQTCARPGEIEYEKEVVDKIYLDIKLLGFDMNRDAEKGVNCSMGQYRPDVVIPLSRQELSGIRQVRFRTLYQIDYYNVIQEQDYLALRQMKAEDPLVVPLEDPRFDDPLGHWFYPDNTVLLFVPNPPANMDVKREVEKFAGSRGLTPLGQIVKSFRPGMRDDSLHYYVDPSGQLPGMISGDGMHAVGAITSWKNVRDVGGMRKIPVQHDVYARVPGVYE